MKCWICIPLPGIAEISHISQCLINMPNNLYQKPGVVREHVMSSMLARRQLHLQHVNLLYVQISTEVCTCCSSMCTLQMISQQPMVIEPCFNFLNTLAGAGECFCSPNTSTLKKVVLWVSVINISGMVKVKADRFHYIVIHQRGSAFRSSGSMC